jgi:hypothetical protein
MRASTQAQPTPCGAFVSQAQFVTSQCQCPKIIALHPQATAHSTTFHSSKEITMYAIIVRNQGYNHEYKTASQIDAHTLFHALTKTFLHVEMWSGNDMVQQYKNC